jgi:hypothetical protein
MALFESSTEFLLFDYFRVPYRVKEQAATNGKSRERLHFCTPRGRASSPALYWPRFDPGSGRSHAEPAHLIRSTPFYGPTLADEVAAEWLRHTGQDWIPVEPVKTGAGDRAASVWRSADGDIFIPFDPSRAIRTLWSEAYERPATRPLKRGCLRAYYRLRPLLPRRTQIWLRRLLARVQARRRFPRWPVETSLPELYELLFEYLTDVSGSPIPAISFWPRGCSWAFVLTHDVETEVGYRHLDILRSVERDLGYRSSWNFVPRRYTVHESVVHSLADEGFEVGVHGLYHDGRDLESASVLAERLPEIERHAQRWGALGFRSPATHRDWELMPLLPFAYDSSYPDTDPFEPRSGGCCSLLPFFIEGLVELPITLPQDHTLFTILRHCDESAWIAKTDEIRRRQGMALLITHPDYMIQEARVVAYGRFLQAYRDDTTAWRALPREVAEWWRRRQASWLELQHGKWRVVGPAADDASVVWYGTPRGTPRPGFESRPAMAGGAEVAQAR